MVRKDKTYRKNLQITVDPILWKEFGDKCHSEGRIMYRVVEDLIKDYLEK